MLTVGSLFAGIGGFELGLERTGGFKTEWQCEIDPFCLKVLATHWPEVKRFTDIKLMGIEGEKDIPYVDVICGGFPCQDISCAGKGAGIHAERRSCSAIDRCDRWSTEPDLGRVANGVPSRVDRLRSLGNAIVPQCAQYVGQCLLDAIKEEA